jgi:putative CocE/NonD family hydrolase
MSYHPAAYHAEPPAQFPSSTPDRFKTSRPARELETRMRDGVVLRSDLYMPENCDRAPAILIRQPYGRATPAMAFAQTGSFWARKGYACVVQDVRGKFSSDGIFDPMVHEAHDGHDTVDWVSRQPWCSGRVGMWGESYYGFTSLAAAVEMPPALACIAPGNIASDRHTIWFRQGAFLLNTIGPWAIAMDAPEYADLSRIDPWHLPLVEMASAAGHEGAYLRTLIDHAQDPAWWARRGVRDRLDRIKIPVLFWSGWYDNYTSGFLEDFAALERSSPNPEHIHLFVGPWDHESSGEHTDRAICVKLPPTGEHRWDTYQAFFDRYLMEAQNGFGAAGKVEYFTIGTNRWQRSSAWPPPGMRPTPFYLRAGGVLATAAPHGGEEPERFRYDPANPVPETIGLNCWALCGQLGDRREIEERADVVSYTTAPLEANCELTGPIKAVLHAASSAVDTDFTVTLVDVFEDGTANQIQDGIIRTSHRSDPYRPSPIMPGEIYAYSIDLAATSYLVKAGHRIRVDVSSSCFDRYDRNTNTGDRFGYATGTKVAEQAIHHSREHPSHILLPLLPLG